MLPLVQCAATYIPCTNSIPVFQCSYPCTHIRCICTCTIHWHPCLVFNGHVLSLSLPALSSTCAQPTVHHGKKLWPESLEYQPHCPLLQMVIPHSAVFIYSNGKVHELYIRNTTCIDKMVLETHVIMTCNGLSKIHSRVWCRICSGGGGGGGINFEAERMACTKHAWIFENNNTFRLQ